MDKLFNKLVLDQTHWDSATPNGLTAIVHKFDKAGEHQVTLLKAGKVVQTFPLQVKKARQAVNKAAAAAAAPPAPTQLNIDLTRLQRPGKELAAAKLIERFAATADDHVLFEANGEAEGYALVAKVTQRGKEVETFNSQKLTPGDYYTITLTRPGKYSLANPLTGAKGSVTMSYPVMGDKPYRPPEPARVQCTSSGFSPAEITLEPFQSLVFEFQAPSRVVVDLVEAIDKPDEKKVQDKPTRIIRRR